MRSSKITLVRAVFCLLLPGCTDDLAPVSDDEAGETGFNGEIPCVGLPDDFPAGDVDCRALNCTVSADRDRKLVCSAVLHTPEGYPHVDFALATSTPGGLGSIPWNELPWNAEAGAWENAEMVGADTVCGYFTINTASILPDSQGDRYVELACMANEFNTSRVYLTLDGPVPD